MGRDVTQEVELESRLAQSQKMEALGQIAGGVAHDFNNMLQVISGYLEVLSARGAVAEEARPYLDEIRKAADRASRLTQQLLVFSRRQVLALKPLDLNEALANSLKMIQRVIGEHIRLSFHPAAGLPSVTADAGQLDQVLLNLCLNARDAMPNGGALTIETFTESVDAEAARAQSWIVPGPLMSACRSRIPAVAWTPRSCPASSSPSSPPRSPARARGWALPRHSGSSGSTGA